MSVFLGVPPSEWVAQNDLAFAIRDTFPVTNGHTLVITRRPVATWWEATQEEQRAILSLIETVKSELDLSYHPNGYNVGFNAGEAAGQTIPHLHVHVIPRYDGDHPDPRGGIRHVIPDKGNYLSDRRPSLVTPRHGHLHRELKQFLADPAYDRVDLLVAFVMRSGVQLLAKHIEEALARGASVRLLTTDYLMTTDVQALGFFLDRLGAYESGGALEARIFSDSTTSFHPKAYLFLSRHRGSGVAFVGSSNLSYSALRRGIEWNLETSHVAELASEFDQLWDDPRSVALTATWLDDYEQRRTALGDRRSEHVDVMIGNETPEQPIAPWSVQREALVCLEATRLEGHRAGLVVMATGLGKTWLAAFDSTRPSVKRVLFVAHREEILQTSRDVFRRVRPGARFGFFTGGERSLDSDVTFASVQSLQRNLDRFQPDDFDYIVVDEFHHAAAPTYRRVLSHFTPDFMLGLTATPDRTDAADLLALCDDNLVYECGLLKGLRRDLLSPFRYRAIRDVADYAQIPWRSGRFVIEDLSEQLETQQRAEQVFTEWQALDGPNRRALGFCCSVTHANFMASYFAERGVRAAAVHSGAGSDDREESLVAIEEGELQVLFSVDLFNEGIDVPTVDIVMMLRPTDSSIVFFQQLGRGLRKAEGKDYLDVLDLVGNHRSFLLKARMLTALGGALRYSDREAVAALREVLTDLPPGCSIVVETEAIELMEQLLGKPTRQDALAELSRSWADEHDGQRPTALEMSLVTGGAHELKAKGGWFGFLNGLGLLSDDEQAILSLAHDFLLSIEHGAYTKSYKLVTLRVMLDSDQLRSGMTVKEIALASRWRVFGSPRLKADLHDASSQFTDHRNPTDQEWIGYWRRNPIHALTAVDGKSKWFRLVDDRVELQLAVPTHLAEVFDEMVGEIVDYRLHRYLMTKAASRPARRLKPHAPDGTLLDAAFHLQAELGEPVSVLFESAGGARGTPSARNVDYVAGIDAVLERLAGLGATLTDAFLETERTANLSVNDRRLVDPSVSLPAPLSSLDLNDLRRSMLRRMAVIGRKPGKESGGNSRKAFRVVLGGLDQMVPDQLETALVSGRADSRGIPVESTGLVG